MKEKCVKAKQHHKYFILIELLNMLSSDKNSTTWYMFILKTIHILCIENILFIVTLSKSFMEFPQAEIIQISSNYTE